MVTSFKKGKWSGNRKEKRNLSKWSRNIFGEIPLRPPPLFAIVAPYTKLDFAVMQLYKLFKLFEFTIRLPDWDREHTII